MVYKIQAYIGVKLYLYSMASALYIRPIPGVEFEFVELQCVCVCVRACVCGGECVC